MKILLTQIKKTDPLLRKNMAIHYSKPKGFVGRSICYEISVDGVCYGHIVGGSATKFLPGRNKFFNINSTSALKHIVNNVFYHIEKVNGKYPCRWFTAKVVKEYIKKINCDWYSKYGDIVIGHETLVELPRTGLLYKKVGFVEVGITKGYTCKRIGGMKSTDSWTGRRIWNTTDLRPKRVLCLKNKKL